MEPLYPEGAGHKNNFDIARFIMASLVVFTHEFLVYYGPDDFLVREPLWRFTHNQLAFGTLAVNFFFIISGMLVLKSLLQSKSNFNFIIKRVLRIYPAFIVVILFCGLIVGPLGTIQPGDPLPNFTAYWSQIDLGYLSYTFRYLATPYFPETFQHVPCKDDTNTSVWTISFEFGFYLLLACLSVFGVFKMRKIVLFCLFCLIMGVNIYFFKAYATYNGDGIFTAYDIPLISPEKQEDFLNAEHLLLFFLSGACFYYYRKYIPKSRWLFVISCIVMLIASKWISVFELAMSVFGSYILFYLIFSKRIRAHNFGKFGDLSYGIYLFGWPVQQLVMNFAGTRIGYGGNLALSYFIILIIAFLSWHLVEKPALALKSKTADLDIFKNIKLRYLK